MESLTTGPELENSQGQGANPRKCFRGGNGPLACPGKPIARDSQKKIVETAAG